MKLLRTVVTHLEMDEPPPGDPKPFPPGFEAAEVVREPAIALPRYRALYDAVGRPHHWTSRLVPDERLAAEIHAPDIAVFVLALGAETLGWFEIETSPAEERARIVHFAIMPRFRGRGLARPMLERAIRSAFGGGVRRLAIETNTLDHPAALGLYRSAGFRAVTERDVLTPPIEAFDARGG